MHNEDIIIMQQLILHCDNSQIGHTSNATHIVSLNLKKKLFLCSNKIITV